MIALLAPTARVGVWTPWAKVLCVECDYAVVKEGERARIYARHVEALAKMDRTAVMSRPDGDLLAVCDTCRCACWVREDVALLQAVGYEATEIRENGAGSWELQQTGGMCAALVFTAGGREIVVTAMDGNFTVGAYKRQEESSWDSPLRIWESATFGESGDPEEITTAERLAMECARQATEFILDAVREEHQSAVGATCKEGPDGMCLACLTEMTTCNVCGGIAYHREGCSRIEGDL